MREKYILWCTLLAALLLVSACTPVKPESLLGFWKVEQVQYWDFSGEKWVVDTETPHLYNLFLEGGRLCPRSEGRFYISVLPSESCYLVEKDKLILRSGGESVSRWKISGSTLEILNEIKNKDGSQTKIKVTSHRATKPEAIADGFPYEPQFRVIEEIVEE